MQKSAKINKFSNDFVSKTSKEKNLKARTQ